MINLKVCEIRSRFYTKITHLNYLCTPLDFIDLCWPINIYLPAEKGNKKGWWFKK